MAKRTYAYRPDYAVPPGLILEEHLKARGFSQAEFARRCGRSPKLISEIIAGKARLEPMTALQFERVLAVDMGIWLGIESKYQNYKIREAEAKAHRDWIRQFPVRDLVDRKCFTKPRSDADALSKLFSFFAVGSIDAWNKKVDQSAVAYRHSPSFQSDKAALATWLRLGELEAERQVCADYNKTSFHSAMRRVRGLTQEPIESALAAAQEWVNAAGIALAIVKPFQNMAVSGAAWWLSPNKAVIQLSARFLSDDHLWFCFFHEAAHILRHSKKLIFIEGKRSNASDLEKEANKWASNELIDQIAWTRFTAMDSFSECPVKKFARQQGIAPGIVVGRLQHDGWLDYSQLNHLKTRYSWTED